MGALALVVCGGLPGQCCRVGGPGEVLGDMHTLKLGTAHPLHSSTVDGQRNVLCVIPPEVHNNLLSIVQSRDTNIYTFYSPSHFPYFLSCWIQKTICIVAPIKFLSLYFLFSFFFFFFNIQRDKQFPTLKLHKFLSRTITILILVVVKTGNKSLKKKIQAPRPEKMHTLESNWQENCCDWRKWVIQLCHFKWSEGF